MAHTDKAVTPEQLERMGLDPKKLEEFMGDMSAYAITVFVTGKEAKKAAALLLHDLDRHMLPMMQLDFGDDADLALEALAFNGDSIPEHECVRPATSSDAANC